MRNVPLARLVLCLIPALVTLAVALRPDLGTALTVGATVLASLAAALALISSRRGISGSSTGQHRDTAVRRGILALDIEGFGQPSRTDPDRAQLRTHLHALLDHALATAQISPSQVAARNDLGDGILVLFDPIVPAATLLHPLLTDLTTRLAAYNQTKPAPQQRLRLRVAVHDGYVLADAHGHTGEDLNHTFRLLDAEATRTILADTRSANAVLIVSDPVYRGIVRHGYQGLDPAVWQPIRIHAKETRTRAWVHLPGLTPQPNVPIVLAAPAVGPASLPIPRELPGSI